MKVMPTIAMIEAGGRRGDNCPYALAIEAACPKLAGKVRVYGSFIRIDGFRIDTPSEMMEWILRYDSTKLNRSYGLPGEIPPAPEVDLLLEPYCS